MECENSKWQEYLLIARYNEGENIIHARGERGWNKFEKIERWDNKERVSSGGKKKQGTHMEINVKTKRTKDT